MAEAPSYAPWTLLEGDMLATLKEQPKWVADAVVCDPPYGLSFMQSGWDHDVPGPQYWLRVLHRMKPGAHLVAFSSARTYHRLACAIEDAGFELRDTLMWMYGKGMPKSHDVSKAIDKAAGATREVVGQKYVTSGVTGSFGAEAGLRTGSTAGVVAVTAPATEDAKRWDGWGTALKPAWEPVVLARRPLSEGTVAANVLRWGTGALNIGATRIPLSGADEGGDRTLTRNQKDRDDGWRMDQAASRATPLLNKDGRWPANVALDEAAASALDDAHGASRYFYCGKATARDRRGTRHPCCKPISLLRWLVRMVVPQGGVVLDPFCGSGTVGEAALLEGCVPLLCEREHEYAEDCRRRMAEVTEELRRTP